MVGYQSMSLGRLGCLCVWVCVIDGRKGWVNQGACLAVCRLCVYVCLCGCGTKRSTTTETHGTTKNYQIDQPDARRWQAAIASRRAGTISPQDSWQRGRARVCDCVCAVKWEQHMKSGEGKMLLPLAKTQPRSAASRRGARTSQRAHTTCRRHTPAIQSVDAFVDPNDRFECSSRGANNVVPTRKTSF